jgi:glucose-1-phosphate thymidylyltransferase
VKQHRAVRDLVTGVVLAGGRGSRLAPLTDQTSKQLLPVGGKTLVLRAIGQLVDAGIADVLLVIDERHASQFMGTIRDGRALGLRSLAYVWQSPAGEGLPSAIAKVEHHVRTEKLLVACGDMLVEDGIAQAVADFAEQPSGARLLGAWVDDHAGYTPLRVDGDGVLEILDQDRKRHAAGYMDIGFYFYHRDVFDRIKPLRPSLRGETEIWDLNRAYVRRGELSYTEVRGWWADVGGSLAVYRDADRRYGRPPVAPGGRWATSISDTPGRDFTGR